MNFFKKKVVIIPFAIIILLVLIGTVPKIAGLIMMLGSVGAGIYLYTKNEKFKGFGRPLKVLITAALAFVFLFGVGGFNYNPQLAEQQRLASEKAKLVQQQKADAEKKAQEAKKLEEAKKAEEAKKKAADEKSKILAKFNLKEATVSRVVDGDTIELSDKSKLRFIGVNTPESTTKTESYGKEASEYTKNQLTGKTVYLEKDVSETDKFGRLLRYVWTDIPKEINESEIKAKMFNAKLVSEGYAEVSTYPPDVKYQQYFTKYNAEARNENKGLWAINHNGTTKGDINTNTAQSSSSISQSSSVQKSTSASSSTSVSVASSQSQPQPAQSNNVDETVYVTNTGGKYHRAGCKYLRKSQNAISKSQAINSGYSPCSYCNP